MESSGGEIDVIKDEREALIFSDCSREVPLGRRDYIYDKDAAIASTYHPGHLSAKHVSHFFNIKMFEPEAYRELQTIGQFDRGSRTWLNTPSSTRSRGYALLGGRTDRQYSNHYGVLVDVDPLPAYLHAPHIGLRGWTNMPKI